MGLKEFLINAKAGLAEIQTCPKVHVVIGNESCDLDSTVSAVTYAYFLHQTQSKPDTYILPILNIPRQHYRLRLEVIYLLNKHHIVEDDLIFVDDLDLRTLVENDEMLLTVTLVDHHECSKGQECLGDFVVEVLDHRPLSWALPESWDVEVERVGSCCTLVARRMLASEGFNLDQVVAELLLGTILMDTGNMSASINVGTPTDLEVISQLKSYVSPDTADLIYEGIQNAKSDLSSLTVLEMLYKDMKALRGTHITVAMSSISTKLEDVMSRPEFADSCGAFCSACPADVLIIMAYWKDGGAAHRGIAVFSWNRIYREQITDVLLSSVLPNLELELITSYSHLDNVTAFFQHNVQVSRKGAIPLIREFLAGESNTPDENLNAVDNLAQLYAGSPLGSDLLGEMADVSDEEVRKHINLAKTFQSDQFRTSQDRYDLAAVGTDPVISASLSSDSEFSSSDNRKDGGFDDDDTDDNINYNKVELSENFEFNSGAKMFDDSVVNNASGAGDGVNVDALVEMKEAVSSGDGAFVDNLIDFGFDGKDDRDLAAEIAADNGSDFTDLAVGHDYEFVSNSLDAGVNFEPHTVDQASLKDFDVKATGSRDDTTEDLFSVHSDNVDLVSATEGAKDENNFGDAFFSTIGAKDENNFGDAFLATKDAMDENNFGDAFLATKDAMDENNFGDAFLATKDAKDENNFGDAFLATKDAMDENNFGDAFLATKDAMDENKFGDAFLATKDAMDENNFGDAFLATKDAKDENNFGDAFLDHSPGFEPHTVDQASLKDFDVKATGSRDDTTGDLFSVHSDNVDVDYATMGAKDENNFGDAFLDHSPFNLLGPDIVESPVDISSLPTSNQTSGQGSKIPSYPETPPNSCMEPSNAVFNKETQLPSFNSSEMVKRIHEKKAALAGYGGKQKMGAFDDEGVLEGQLLGGENSSGGGSLISPAVPQNSYVDISTGFDFQSSDSQLPKLMNSDIMERVNEKRSHFEWSLESLEGSTSGVDIGPVSEEGADKSPFVTDEALHISGSGGIEPQVPYTPQNSYVEENFDSYARNNLPSLNNAEIVAKIKAKQSVMFGSHGSSRVSRSSHGSDDSGGCHSPDVVDNKSPRGTSLDSPQAPYTPQNSYRDNLGVFETRNHLPDLNEVAERLSTENPLKRQFGKRSTSNSGGGSRDEENVNLNIHQHSLRHYGRNSSSQSDSQNTMSDVESLMSVSTDVGTPSENIVASGLANQMRSEIAMLSRKDTNDSDVFPPNKIEDLVSNIKEVSQPRVSSIDLTSDNTTSNNIVGSVPNGIDTEASDDGVRGDSAGVKELFSPFDSEKVQSLEDHALFHLAESIVAQSVAAAVEFSQKETHTGAARKESRLRWNDNVELDNMDNQSDDENSQRIFVADEEEEDEDNDGSDIEDDTVGDISESFPENELDKMGNENGSMENINSENAVEEEITVESFGDRGFDSDFNSLSVQEQSDSQLDQTEEKHKMTQHAYETYAPEDELTQALESDVLDHSPQRTTSAVTQAPHSITDLALNELAFELANELIQSVLDDFPFSEDLAAIHTEAQAKGQAATHTGKDGMQNISQETPLHNTWAPDSTEKDMTANNDNLTPVDFSAVEAEAKISMHDLAEDLTVKHSAPVLESKLPSADPNSVSSSERKRLKDTDSSLVIPEDEIITSFPERKMSTEFPALEEEDEMIESFPGRKFSKSEDYPTRRFSRDDNSSRRSSRYEDSELEVTIGPEDIETGYLPNVDPLQGNLDIFETSFSKITDADREVVEGESFRKVSGEGIGSDWEAEEEEEDRSNGNEDGSSQKENDGYHDESSIIVGVEDGYADVMHEDGYADVTQEDGYAHVTQEDGYADVTQEDGYVDVTQEDGYVDVTHKDGFVASGRIIPEVREELVSDDPDSSSEIESQVAGDGAEADMFADFSREQHVVATDISGVEQTVEIPKRLEDQITNDFDELDSEANDVISWTERQVDDVSNEMRMQGPTKHEVDFLPAGNIEVDEAEDAETSSEVDDLGADVSNEMRMQGSTKHEVDFLQAGKIEVEEAEDAETSSEVEDQAAESELEVQAETLSVLKAQTATTLSELEQIADTKSKFELETSKVVQELKEHISETSPGGDISKEEASMLEVIKVPKQKKKIRVSFSEDFDDEIGDFNITSSSRSSLKSPPPLPSSEDSESPSPTPSLENINAAVAEEYDVSPLSSASSHWPPHEQAHQKEVYHTTAGRISIGVGEEEDSSSRAFNNEFSPNVASFTDEIIMKARAQVGEIIESAKGTISEADQQLEVTDASLHASDAAELYFSDVSQPELSSRTFQSANDAAVMSEGESNNAFSIVSSDFAAFDPTNFDPSAVNSNPFEETSVKPLVDSHNVELTEPSAVTSEPLIVSQQEPVPAVLAVSMFEDGPFDSLSSLPTHARNLSSGSVQGAVYSEEWQDDEIEEVAAQSGLEAAQDDAMRKKIVPDSDFVEAVVTDNETEGAEDEDNKEEDEESDAGDLEWENDTPVEIPTRPGIQPTLAAEEASPEGQRWKRVSVSGSDFDIDLQAVEPFKNVLSHGGYYDEGLSAIIVFYGCNLPSRTREDYAYIMNHLFHYVIHTLEELVADDYVIIYFHGSTPRRQMPSLAWLKRCYQSIDRRLKKNLKGLFLVHPTLWLRTIVMMTKPFISTKFSSKLRFVRTLEELNALVPLTNVTIPDAIVQFGRRSTLRRRKTM